MTDGAPHREDAAGSHQDRADKVAPHFPRFVEPFQAEFMVRVGGLGYRIDVGENIGSRISEMTLLKSGAPIDPGKSYIVSGWASVNEGTEGPPIYDVVSQYIEKQGTVSLTPNESVRIVGI